MFFCSDVIAELDIARGQGLEDSSDEDSCTEDDNDAVLNEGTAAVE